MIRRVFYIPVRRRNGTPVDKVFFVYENTDLYRKLLHCGNGRLPEYIIIDN